LDNIDLGKKIAKEDQHFVDLTLARHKVLCEMLGLTDDIEKPYEQSEPKKYLYAQFEAININDFKE
jgi:ribosome assembly protein YihI (activator of Der GTPase)